MRRFLTLMLNDLYRYATSSYTYIKLIAYFFISNLTFFAYLGAYNHLVSMKIVASREQANLLNIDVQVLQNYYFMQIMLLLFLTPILVSRILSEDKQGNMLEVFFASKLSSFQYVFAKTLTALTLMSLVMLTGNVLPLILVIKESLALSTVILGFLACCLSLLLMTITSIFVSVKSRFNSMSAIITIFIAAILYGLDPISAKLPAAIATVVQQFSLLHHSRAIVEAKPALHNFAYFLIVSTVLFVWSLRAYNSERWR